MTVVLKPSQARKYWFILLLAVLLILFAQMRGAKKETFNLLVNGSDEAQGAKVLVDGREVGTLKPLSDSDFGGTACWVQLTDGRHDIEVDKLGFEPFKTNISMSTEAFVAVDLRAKNP